MIYRGAIVLVWAPGAVPPTAAILLAAAIAIGLAIYFSRLANFSGGDAGWFRSAVSSAPFAMIEVDAEGRMRRANPSAANMFGYQASELSGQPLSMLLPQFERQPCAGAMVSGLHRSGLRFFAEVTYAKTSGASRSGGIAYVHDVIGQEHSKEALGASEQHMSLILQMLPGFLWTSGRNGELEYVSQNVLDYTGMTLEQLNRDWRAAVHPDDVAMRERSMEQMVRTAEPVERELRVRRSDGVYRWFHSRTQALRDHQGQVVRWYGISWDIEERKRAEEALRQSEHDLRLIVETMPVLVWVARPDGGVEHSNQRLIDTLGVGSADLLEYEWVHTVHPDDAEAALRQWLKCVRAGGSFEATHRHRCADGNYRWFEARAEPLRDPDGRVLRWFGLLFDIDDRKKAEEALRESERRLRLMIEAIPAQVWRTAADGDPDYINQRMVDFTGRSLDDFAHSGWKKLVHPDDLAGAERAWADAIGAGGMFETTHRIRRADGVYHWFNIRGGPLRDQDGRVVHWYGLNLDIDDSKKMAAALRSTREKLSRASQIATVAELSASIAHEINQPLAAVIANGYACQRWLAAEPPNLPRARLALERIIRDGNSAAGVVRRIRALFKQAAPAKLPVDINDVIGEALRVMAHEAERANVRVETDLEQALPRTLADRVQLQQVIVNLVRNVIEAMEGPLDEKLLLVGSQRRGTEIAIEIRDRGPGLPDPEKVFEPFYTTKETGMGMGLAICRSIVEAHDGRLWAAANDGPGTIFSFTLPIRPGEAG